MKSWPPSSSDNYIPGIPDPAVDNRKDRFDRLNAFIMARNGWITSVPGAIEVTVEVLPGSPLIAELEAAGYDVQPGDPPEGERIIANAIVEHITAGSTAHVEVRRHAGIVRVSRFSFDLL